MTSAPGELAVSIVLPAFNEEANIEQAVAEATRVAGRLFGDHEAEATLTKPPAADGP